MEEETKVKILEKQKEHNIKIEILQCELQLEKGNQKNVNELSKMNIVL